MKTTRTILVAVILILLAECHIQALDTNQIAEAIADNIFTNYSQIAGSTVYAESQKLASQINSVTNYQSLYNGLTNALYADTNLAIPVNDISKIGQQITFILMQSMPESDLSSANILSNSMSSVVSKYLDFEAGVVVLSPFSVSGTGNPKVYELAPSDSDVRGMIQATFQYREAWREDYARQDSGANDTEIFIVSSKRGYPLPTFDWEFRAGYAYGGPDSSQSSTTTGSGDLYEDASFGINLLKHSNGNKPGELASVYTINAEGFEAAATDKKYSLIHPAGGVGISFVGGFPMHPFPNSTAEKKFEIFTRTGIAWVDSPKLIGIASDGNAQVLTDNDGNPDFSIRAAWATTAELRVPVGFAQKQYGYLSLGGTFYKSIQANRDQWSMYAAYTISLNNIIQGVVGLVTGNTQ